jgi:hypothetical protein
MEGEEKAFKKRGEKQAGPTGLHTLGEMGRFLDAYELGRIMGGIAKDYLRVDLSGSAYAPCAH